MRRIVVFVAERMPTPVLRFLSIAEYAALLGIAVLLGSLGMALGSRKLFWLIGLVIPCLIVYPWLPYLGNARFVLWGRERTVREREEEKRFRAFSPSGGHSHW